MESLSEFHALYYAQMEEQERPGPNPPLLFLTRTIAHHHTRTHTPSFQEPRYLSPSNHRNTPCPCGWQILNCVSMSEPTKHVTARMHTTARVCTQVLCMSPMHTRLSLPVRARLRVCAYSKHRQYAQKPPDHSATCHDNSPRRPASIRAHQCQRREQ